tara:strand:- start:127 stop:237 length:111 start_codon:yes stop_codon:yes gene_type:complete
MDGFGLDARDTEVLGDFIRTVFGSGKNEGRIHVVFF